MPTRPRAPKAHRFTDDPIRLSQRRLADLAEHAGLSVDSAKGRALTDDVVEQLSDAANLHRSLERGPSSAGQAVLLRKVEEAAAALERALLDLDQGSLMEMPRFVLDDDDRPRLDAIASVRLAAKREREWCERGRRKGRPSSTQGRGMAIEQLARVFHRRASPSINDHYRIALHDFIEAGLRAAGFNVPRGKTKDDPTEGREILRLVPEELCSHRRTR